MPQLWFFFTFSHKIMVCIPFSSVQPSSGWWPQNMGQNLIFTLQRWNKVSLKVSLWLRHLCSKHKRGVRNIADIAFYTLSYFSLPYPIFWQCMAQTVCLQLQNTCRGRKYSYFYTSLCHARVTVISFKCCSQFVDHRSFMGHCKRCLHMFLWILASRSCCFSSMIFHAQLLLY